MTPSLVLLPGLNGTGDLFAPVLAQLDGRLLSSIVVYPSAEPLDYPAHESIVRAALPTDRPFVLLGESFSGPIAIRIAASAPAGLRGLILCASFVRCPRPSLRVLSPLTSFVSPRARPNWLTDFLLLGSYATPDLRRMLRQSLAGVSDAVMQSRVTSILNVDVSQDAREVRVPTLYLRGRFDRLVPARCATAIARLVPSYRILDINAPHALLQAAPAIATGAIEAFVASVA